MLEVDSLQYAYSGAVALEDVSLSVNEGEVVTVLGPNGAGKTTTVKNIAGVLHPDDGRITYDGEDITQLPAHETVERRIKLVPDRGVFKSMSVHENLLLGVRSLKENQHDEQLEYVFDLFPRLEERRDQRAGTLSGGEQQMLAIALGLTADPDLLILDEPSLGLMPSLVEEIFDRLVKINESGMSVLLVEQNIYNALGISDRGYVLENGRTTITGTGSELLNDERIRERYLAIE